MKYFSGFQILSVPILQPRSVYSVYIKLETGTCKKLRFPPSWDSVNWTQSNLGISLACGLLMIDYKSDTNILIAINMTIVKFRKIYDALMKYRSDF